MVVKTVQTSKNETETVHMAGSLVCCSRYVFSLGLCFLVNVNYFGDGHGRRDQMESCKQKNETFRTS